MGNKQEGQRSEMSGAATAAIDAGVAIFLWLWSLVFLGIASLFFGINRAAGAFVLASALLVNPLFIRYAVAEAVTAGRRPPSMVLLTFVTIGLFSAGCVALLF
ncbi:hypothetical protein [Sedimenticola hydrogenitrophicus]|uniref:hypothetical protein n=1 Tax=Sedimenticola hydrogenitrophicus TaxID=2967975 RepID=UPI0023AE7512|nr:hypothetical protein [Sedimenticola hydrogenitrophicus]